ncbi:conserved hypothetical protein [Tenacibaculum sediminilitoris]|uniref:hypothetical protein n=1 Tax=Tenacibaculum sediminilitoris TaxID=1820334 RepID=UPI00389357BE
MAYKHKSIIVDLTFLNKTIGNNREGRIMLIKAFLEQSNIKIKMLNEKIHEADFDEIKKITHFLKSSFSFMGLKCAASLSEIENLCEQKIDIKKMKHLGHNVTKNYEKSRLEYIKILSKLLNHS